jgi:hypothetical protein
MSTDWKRYSSVLTPYWLRQFISRVPDSSALPWTEYGVPSGVAEGLNSRSEEPPPRRGMHLYADRVDDTIGEPESPYLRPLLRNE